MDDLSEETIGHIADAVVDGITNHSAALTALEQRAKDLEEELKAQLVARNADRTEWMTTYEAMRAEIESLRCGDLGPFHDGELSSERAAAFRLHLGRCSECAAELLTIVSNAAHLSDVAPTEKR